MSLIAFCSRVRSPLLMIGLSAGGPGIAADDGRPQTVGKFAAAETRAKLMVGSMFVPATEARSSVAFAKRKFIPALITCGDRSNVMLSTNCHVRELRALYEKFVL